MIVVTENAVGADIVVYESVQEAYSSCKSLLSSGSSAVPKIGSEKVVVAAPYELNKALHEIGISSEPLKTFQTVFSYLQNEDGDGNSLMFANALLKGESKRSSAMMLVSSMIQTDAPPMSFSSVTEKGVKINETSTHSFLATVLEQDVATLKDRDQLGSYVPLTSDKFSLDDLDWLGVSPISLRPFTFDLNKTEDSGSILQWFAHLYRDVTKAAADVYLSLWMKSANQLIKSDRSGEVDPFFREYVSKVNGRLYIHSDFRNFIITSMSISAQAEVEALLLDRFFPNQNPYFFDRHALKLMHQHGAIGELAPYMSFPESQSSEKNPLDVAADIFNTLMSTLQAGMSQ